MDAAGGRRRARVPARVVLPLVVAAVLAVAGHERQAALLLLVAGVLAIPRIGQPVERGIGRFAAAAGHAIAYVLLMAVELLFVLPASVAFRLTRSDPLHGPTEPGSSWHRRTDHGPAAPSRPFAPPPPRRRASRTQRAWNAVGIVVVLLAANYLIGWGWDAATDARSGPQTVRFDVDVDAGGATTTVPPFVAADHPWPPVPAPNWITPERLDAAFGDVPWAPEYFYDMAQRSFSAYPYLGTKPNPLATRYVNLTGWERRTYQAPDAPADAPVVWMFGGSTTWGAGQRDEHTIASELVRIAAAEGTPITVRNFGQFAWLNWQEMLLFEQLLASEPAPPDIVVFYDGVNEFTYPPPYDQPAPRSFDPGAEVLAATTVAGSAPTSGLLDAYRRHSMAHKVWAQVRSWVDQPAGAQSQPAWSGDAEAAATARNYDRGATLIRSLAKRRDVVPLLYWQPRLAGVERHDLIRSKIESPLIDVSDALDGSPEVFLDDMHTDERGARLVAAAIWSTLGPEVRGS